MLAMSLLGSDTEDIRRTKLILFRGVVCGNTPTADNSSFVLRSALSASVLHCMVWWVWYDTCGYHECVQNKNYSVSPKKIPTIYLKKQSKRVLTFENRRSKEQLAKIHYLPRLTNTLAQENIKSTNLKGPANHLKR